MIKFEVKITSFENVFKLTDCKFGYAKKKYYGHWTLYLPDLKFKCLHSAVFKHVCIYLSW